MKITESTLLAFEERANDLIACATTINELVAGDSVALREIVDAGGAGTPHEQTDHFAHDLVECCDLRLRAETLWLKDEPRGEGGADVELSTLPRTIDEEEAEALTCLFYCAARLTCCNPWFEESTRDFIALVALEDPSAEALERDARRTPLDFSREREGGGMPHVLLASDPAGALDRLCAAYDLLAPDFGRRFPDPPERTGERPGTDTEAKKQAPSGTAAPASMPASTPDRRTDYPWTDDDDEQRRSDEEAYFESERAALVAWRDEFANAPAFRTRFERLRELWRAGAVPRNAGALAREGLDMLGLQRATSLYRDDATYDAALAALQTAVATLRRLERGARS